jgi:hypothetical protein
MKDRVLTAVVVLGWSVSAFAQPASQISAASERLQMGCAPIALLGTPNSALRVVGSYQRGRLLFGPSEPLIINAGTNQGVQNGQEFFVRRVVNDRYTPMTASSDATSIHTSGWVRIVEAQPDTSVATVTHSCDGVLYGDYLEPFADPVPPPDANVTGEPDYAHPGRIALGDEKRQTGAPGDVMVIDRGSDDGLRAGQVVTIYRETVAEREGVMNYGRYGPVLEGRGPSLRIGTARVVSVRPQTALVRIESSREAVYIGDYVAVHRVTQ